MRESPIAPYTEREWNLLVRQGDPEGVRAFPGDLAAWKPKVERVCARHGQKISPGGEMKWASSGATVRTTNRVFLTGDVAVKVYTRQTPIWFEREVECLRLLGSVPAARTPRLLAHGDAISDRDPDHPYLIMERLPGDPYYAHELSVDERCALASQLAAMVRAMHDAPTEGLTAFGSPPGEWVARIRARAALWEEDVAPGLPPYLAAQGREFLAENLPYVTEAFRPCLLSADLHVGHILIARQRGEWRVTGHIDLGDAEVGPVEYEWVPVCQKLFTGDVTLMRAFFSAYGWPLPVSHEVRQRLKLYTLLHRFPPLHFPPRDASEGPSLEAILDALWPI